MAIIDPNKTWVPLEERLARTTNPRHRQMLEVVIEHMKAEAAPDMERLMATLAPDPDYHFWIAGADAGPKGTDGVRTYYTSLFESGTNVLEFEVDRLIVDDENLVTEGWIKMIYPGSAAADLGVDIDDPAGDYLLVFRQLVVWPIDTDGLVKGEDAYYTGPVSVTKLSTQDLPQRYLDQRTNA